MSGTYSAKRYLELFDELNLENVEDRRIGVILLRYYFSTVLVNIENEKLVTIPSLNEMDLDKQWRLVLEKFASIQGTFSDEFEGQPFQIVSARNSVSHNDLYDPRQDIDDLRSIRAMVPDWKDETEQMAEAYFYDWEDLSPKEALVDLARRNLDHVLSVDPEFERFSSDYAEVQETAASAMESLTEIDHDKERIEKKLVEIVELSQDLSIRIESLEIDEGKYADYLANDVRDHMSGR